MLSFPGPRTSLLALALALYAPLAVLGYGSDFDAYGVVESGRLLVGSGFQAYDHSRNPGYFLHELATGLLDALGGALAANLGTLAMALVAVGCFHAILERLRIDHAGWLTAAFVVHPYVWINAAATMDYVWALGFLMAGWLLALDGRWRWAGVAFGLAVGARLSSVLVVGAVLAFAFARRPAARRGGVEAAALALGIGALLYVPPLLVEGSPLGLLQPAGMDSEEQWTWPLRLGRFAYKNMTFWGLPGVLLLLTALVRHRRVVPRRRALLGLCAVVVLVVEALYLRYPLERAYLLPMLPFVLVGFGLLVRDRRWVVGLVGLIVLHAFVALDLAKPDRPNSAQGAEFGLWIGPGPLVADVRQRLRLRGCEDRACWYRVMDATATPGPEEGPP